jgi:hypothetical protein
MSECKKEIDWFENVLKKYKTEQMIHTMFLFPDERTTLKSERELRNS